MTKVSSRTST